MDNKKLSYHIMAKSGEPGIDGPCNTIINSVGDGSMDGEWSRGNFYIIEGRLREKKLF